MKPNQEEKDLLSYLEGEIKCVPGGIHIMINEDFLCSISFPVSDKVSINDMQKFVAESVINERERRKEQVKPKTIILTQRWNEDENGFYSIGGWFEPEGYILKEVTELDKFGNPIEAIFQLITPKKEEDNETV